MGLNNYLVFGFWVDDAHGSTVVINVMLINIRFDIIQP